MRLFLIVLLFNLKCAFSQPAILWQKTIGGTSNDVPWRAIETTDGGFIIGGWSKSDSSYDKSENSRGNYDFWIIKFNSIGIKEWDKTFGGDYDEYMYAMTETTDSCFIIGGTSPSHISGDKIDSSRGVNDCWVLKIDRIGNIIWQRTIGGGDDDDLYTLVKTDDGGCLLGASSKSNISSEKLIPSKGGFDIWLVKLDSLGNIQWQKAIGGSSSDNLSDMKKTSDGNYILCGNSISSVSGDKTEVCRGSTDFWVIKIDSVGNILWQRTIGGNDVDKANSIVETPSGDYVIAGTSISNISGDKTENSRGGTDMWIIKLSANGNIRWQRTIGGNDEDIALSLDATSMDDVVVAGYSYSNASGEKLENSNGSDDYWILKFDSFGNLIWEKVIGGTQSDEATFVKCLPNNEYFYIGYSVSDICPDKTDNSLGGSDFWIMKTNIDVGLEEIIASNRSKIFPNPVIENLIVESPMTFVDQTISIFDIYGSKVNEIKTNNSREVISCKNLPIGVYIVIIEYKGNLDSKIFIKTKL